jgi:hypothetical protein
MTAHHYEKKALIPAYFPILDLLDLSNTKDIPDHKTCATGDQKHQ